MQFTIVSGSHRQPSQSRKVADHIERVLKQQVAGAEVGIIDLANNPFPLWDEGVWRGEARWQTLLEEPSRQLAASDGVVVIAPEWHGQVPAGLKNFFLLFGAKELGHKPGLIVTVSASEGGTYPVAELRMSSAKNNRLCYIPEHLIIRQVESVLNDDAAQNDAERDGYLRGRIAWTLELFAEYARALQAVRTSGKGYSPDYPFGM